MEFKPQYWHEESCWVINFKVDSVIIRYLNLTLEEFHSIIRECGGTITFDKDHYFLCKKDCEECIEKLLPYIMLAKLSQ